MSAITDNPEESPVTAERIADGRKLRGKTAVEAHGQWTAPADRPDPVDILEKQAAEREADLVPIRYGRMLASAFAFYRGGAANMPKFNRCASPQAWTRIKGIK